MTRGEEGGERELPSAPSCLSYHKRAWNELLGGLRSKQARDTEAEVYLIFQAYLRYERRGREKIAGERKESGGYDLPSINSGLGGSGRLLDEKRPHISH